MKLYRYQHIPGKVASVKEKVSTMFTSNTRLVNACMYQISLQPSIDAMLFCSDFVEFQILADHTQDVGNQNKGYQYISQDLWSTTNSTCQISNWTSAETHQEEMPPIPSFYTKTNSYKGFCTALYCVVCHHKHNLI